VRRAGQRDGMGSRLLARFGRWWWSMPQVSPDPPSSNRSSPDAAYFDHWYQAMESCGAQDAMLARHLALPADVGSAGILHWDAVGEITRELGVPDGGLLVDLACGRGSYGIEVARRSGATLIGIDFSVVALDRARATASRRLPAGQGTFQRGTLTECGLPEGEADALMCTDSVQFAEPPVAALREMCRVLRSGGRLALTTWQAATVGDPRVAAQLRHLDLEADLRAAGFGDVVVEDRPTWRAAERRLWEEAVATTEHQDPALTSLQEEGRRSLQHFDALRRVVAFATAP
jgi:SAM-dependent methyltransferase